MVELTFVIWGASIFFAYIGYKRGWTKEVISTSGIILALFALHEFDPLMQNVLFVGLPKDQIFYLQSTLFLVIVFFAYQTKALVGGEANRARSGDEGRDSLQTNVLGALVGFLNGYLIFGSLWYFLDNLREGLEPYALDPYVVAPPPGSTLEQAIANLPLNVLAPNGNNELLALSVIVLFVIVLVII